MNLLPDSVSQTIQSGSLHGIRIVITRAAHQAEKQRRLLAELGAEVYHYPCIDIVPPLTVEPLDQGLRAAAAGEFEWLVLTSVNTIEMLASRLAALQMRSPALARLKVATVGSVTEQAAHDQLGVTVHVVPDEYTGEQLAAAMQVKQGSRVLFPQSALAKPTLAAALRAAGADVTVVEAYRNVMARGGDPVPVLLWEGKIDAITFTSESTVRFFAKRLNAERGTLAMLDDVVVACIGPTTAATARQFGLHVAVLPEAHTLEGLTRALADHFNRKTLTTIARRHH